MIAELQRPGGAGTRLRRTRRGHTKGVSYALAAVAVITTLSGCASASGYRSEQVGAPSCEDLLAAAVQFERSGGGDIDSVLQALTASCSDEYEIAVGYLSNSTDSEFRIESCEKLLDYGVRHESVELLAQDGTCRFDAPDVQAAESWPDGGLGWDQASVHAGTVQRICGPLMSTRSTEDGTFVNVGRDYPSADRFTFIFWDMFLDPIEAGATVCGSGEVYLYEGVAQMEMWDPTTLEIWR